MKLTFDYSLVGLEPRDLKVYETMLASPEASSVRTVASNVNMNRGTVFEIIKKLVLLGLVSGHYKNSRKIYRAEPPSALKRLGEERSVALSNEIPKIDAYVKKLEVSEVFEPQRPFGKLYEGPDEIAVLLQDVLSIAGSLENKSYSVISSAEVSNHLYSKFRNFTNERVRQKIFVKVISVGTEGGKAQLSERKTLSSYNMPASYIIIYGPKVAQITLTSLGEIQGSVVENKGIADLQSLLFEKLWEKL